LNNVERENLKSMKINKLIYFIASFVAIFNIAGCEKEKDFGSVGEAAITISSITVAETPFNSDAETICLLTNQELQLNTTVSPAEGITFPEITWTSSDESVVTVSETGKLSAVNIGTAIVRVTPAIGFGPTAATPSITVRVLNQYVYMNSIRITGAPEPTDSIDVGTTLDLGVTFTTDSGEPATFIRYKWTSSNPQVASIDENGVVTGIGQGSTIITCQADDQNPGQKPSTSVEIRVKKVIPIQTLEIINDTELGRLGYGQEYQIRFNVTPADATVSSIKWESDNEAVVSVSRTGKLTVNSMDGAMAVITATAGSIVKKVNVAVAQGRLWYSFADKFTPWTVTTGGAAVQQSDGTKTTIQMSNPTNTGTGKHRGDINLVTNGSGKLMTVNLSTYRYLAVKIRVPSQLIKGTNSQGTIKLEMFDNPRTIGPVYCGTTPGSTNQNNQYDIFGSSEISTTEPNVLYFDLQGAYSGVNPTTWAVPFNLVQFKFVIADFPVAVNWLYDIYWVRTFQTIEEMTAFVSSEQ
jgi:uncharacterized protein YjdB